MSNQFIIEGGQPLSGKVFIAGNKNEALPALAATLMSEHPVTLSNMPKIGDVATMCEIISELGCDVSWPNETTVTICAKNLKSPSPNSHLCEKVRASILFLAPLLARLGKVELALPGGDVIGARRIDSHWEGLTALGADLELTTSMSGTLKKAVGTEIFLDEPSVTGTENIVMLAALAEGRTVIHNAACEPHVAGLCRMLVCMGAKISGIGSNQLTIDGVNKLNGCEHRIGPDFMEAGSFLCLGAIGGGSIEVENIQIQDLRFVLKTLARLGIEPKISAQSLTSSHDHARNIKREISGRIGTIFSGPWPAFPTDLMSVAIVAATQSQGTVIFFEKMFEARMFFTDKLMQMGANIVLCDPHRIVVTGQSQLYGARMSSPDVRAGMALVMAALIAKGTSRIANIYQIERGYMNIYEKLLKLGAKITRERE